MVYYANTQSLTRMFYCICPSISPGKRYAWPNLTYKYLISIILLLISLFQGCVYHMRGHNCMDRVRYASIKWDSLTYIYHYYLLTFGIPWSTVEKALGIGRRAREIEGNSGIVISIISFYHREINLGTYYESNDEGKKVLDQKQPEPATLAADTAHFQYSSCE